jgi:hypothetical protein
MKAILQFKYDVRWVDFAQFPSKAKAYAASDCIAQLGDFFLPGVKAVRVIPENRPELGRKAALQREEKVGAMRMLGGA